MLVVLDWFGFLAACPHFADGLARYAVDATEQFVILVGLTKVD